jgi:hypothetical protein
MAALSSRVDQQVLRLYVLRFHKALMRKWAVKREGRVDRLTQEDRYALKALPPLQNF